MEQLPHEFHLKVHKAVSTWSLIVLGYPCSQLMTLSDSDRNLVGLKGSGRGQPRNSALQMWSFTTGKVQDVRHDAWLCTLDVNCCIFTKQDEQSLPAELTKLQRVELLVGFLFHLLSPFLRLFPAILEWHTENMYVYIYIYCFRRIRFSMWIYDVDSPLACQPPHLSTTQGNHWRSYHAWTNKSQEDCILVVCWGQRRHETIKDCWFICCLLWGQ